MKADRKVDKQFKESRANMCLFQIRFGEGGAHPRS